MFGQALQAPQGLSWLAMLGEGARHALCAGKGRTDRRPAEGPGRTESATILFADICESTPLYRSAGDRRALELVATCLDALAGIARETNGQVVRSKGDDLLCTFADAEVALATARRMVGVQRGTEARVRVALHHGPLIRARGDIFGDAVNLAARVLGLGKADEVLVTGEVFGQIAPLERATLRRIGDHTLKGTREAISLYAALPMEGTGSTTLRNPGTNTLTLGRPRRAEPGSTTLSLECGSQARRCAEGESVLLGRAPTCDLVVAQSWVSREHATITVSQGKLTLKDHSSTGTQVRLADGHEFFVRRETIVLSGSGVLTPGGAHADASATPVRFCLEPTAGACESVAAPSARTGD